MYPGIYRFKWPYLAAHPVPDEHGEVKIYTCHVEIRVGQEEDLENGILATVIITSYTPPGVQNFIESIASKVRLAFFDDIFHEELLAKKKGIPDDQIRWIEKHRFDDHESILEVRLKWDRKLGRYFSPNWIPIRE